MESNKLARSFKVHFTVHFTVHDAAAAADVVPPASATTTVHGTKSNVTGQRAQNEKRDATGDCRSHTMTQ
jgi:hypothetical protein